MCPPTDTPSEPEFVKRAREIRERRDREAYKESSRGGQGRKILHYWQSRVRGYLGRGFTAEANRVLYLITPSDLADYPWSSYRFNALGQANGLVTPHFEWQRLGSVYSQRQAT